jgi:Na+-translocating ferredoxin:NAD+ oxidoreductase RNF subunit RnfB
MPTLFLQGSSYLDKSCEPLSLSIAQNQANTRELLMSMNERINMCLPGIGQVIVALGNLVGVSAEFPVQ